MSASFYWYDYETFGIDAARDRICQFGGRRTTVDLEPVGEPTLLYCKPDLDVLPHPTACLITGITPQQAQREGLPEPEFIARVHAELSRPGTCGAGYNSIRFDDEFTRHALYRNFFDPYEREWSAGCSRFDLIDVVRMCHALRPDGIIWPQHEDGAASFRLELLTQANGLAHEHAHNALSDVDATIALARLVRERQPRLWAHALKLRDKRAAAAYLDTVKMTPVLHVSSKIPASRRCIALVAPIARHPRNNNEVIVFDLGTDPAELLDLPAEDIRDRVFVSREDLPEGVERIPLKGVRANRLPMLAPLEVLRPEDAQRLGFDLARAEAHRQQLLAARELLAEKIREVFAAPEREEQDAELALYGGFASEPDRQRCNRVRATPPDQLAQLQGLFEGPRYNELLLRYRARHFPQTLSADEANEWREFCERKLQHDTGLASITLPQYRELIAALLERESEGGRLKLLQELAQWPALAGWTG